MRTPISGTTRLYGVLGYPVAHSLSPFMHNLWFRASGYDGVYVPVAVRPEAFASAFPALAAIGFRGLNVTYPYKAAAAGAAHRLVGIAGRIGAANTLVLRAGRWWGYNTDGEGFCQFLEQDARQRPHGADVVVLGAGAAAQAVVAALLGKGPRSVTVVNRSPSRLATFPLRSPRLRLAGAGSRDEVGVALAGADVVVHATPVGLAGGGGRLPWPVDVIRNDACVIDLNYTGSGSTLFLDRVRQVEQRYDGLGMLIRQAALAHRLWTRRLPEAALVAGGLAERLP